jgi:DNA-binding transcriptional ArsR family regulator
MTIKHGKKILNAINAERSVTELAEYLKLSTSSVSHSIAQLKMHHCLSERREGNRIYYKKLDPSMAPLSTGPGDPWGHVKTWGQQ